jgi:hypothetical protein
LAYILPSSASEAKDYKGLDGGGATAGKSESASKLMGMLEGGQTPPVPLQALSRAGSADEDDLFNLGCNHSANEMVMAYTACERVWFTFLNQIAIFFCITS